tara:strand:- start:2496 stop:3128 length:633 start_codon:yes stop_codon:yes gene_type:complete
MATRALIGYLDEDRNFTCTYNHYDGYPEGLGKALKDHYNSDEKAKEIANTGYISSVDEDGKIDSKYDEPANKMVLDDDIVEAGLQIGEKVDEYGGDYGYVWFDDEWMTFKNSGIRSIADQFEREMPADGAEIFRVDEMLDEDKKEEMEENYQTKWNQFITENKAIDNMWAVYVKSLVNAIRLEGVDDYTDFSEDDFIEDYENFMADKMDS